MVGHLRLACLKAQFEVVEYELITSGYYTKEMIIAHYPNSVGFFPHNVKQVAYKNHAKYPIKKASLDGTLIQNCEPGSTARYSFSLKIVKSMIDQILERNNAGHCILDIDDNIISKPFESRKKAEIELLTNDRYSSTGRYLISFLEAK